MTGFLMPASFASSSVWSLSTPSTSFFQTSSVSSLSTSSSAPLEVSTLAIWSSSTSFFELSVSFLKSLPTSVSWKFVTGMVPDFLSSVTT
jgi:hypothetical protein